MSTVFLIARDSVRALLHRRLLLAIMLVMLILIVIFSLILGRFNSITVDGAPPPDTAVAEQGLQAPQPEPESFQEALERAQPPPAAAPDDGAREAMQMLANQALVQFFGLVAFGGMVVALFIGATAVSSDVRSGSITMILSRPVARWQFLVGKFGGAMVVLLGYSILAAVAMVIFAQVNDMEMVPAARYAPWLMFCRSLIYASFALVLSTLMHPILAGILPIFLTGDLFFNLFSSGNPVYYLHFLFPTYGPFDATSQFTGGILMGWNEVAILTVYALDLAVVFLLLAMWRFRSKAVT